MDTETNPASTPPITPRQPSDVAVSIGGMLFKAMLSGSETFASLPSNLQEQIAKDIGIMEAQIIVPLVAMLADKISAKLFPDKIQIGHPIDEWQNNFDHPAVPARFSNVV